MEKHYSTGENKTEQQSDEIPLENILSDLKFQAILNKKNPAETDLKEFETKLEEKLKNENISNISFGKEDWEAMFNFIENHPDYKKSENLLQLQELEMEIMYRKFPELLLAFYLKRKSHSEIDFREIFEEIYGKEGEKMKENTKEDLEKLRLKYKKNIQNFIEETKAFDEEIKRIAKINNKIAEELEKKEKAKKNGSFSVFPEEIEKEKEILNRKKELEKFKAGPFERIRAAFAKCESAIEVLIDEVFPELDEN